MFKKLLYINLFSITFLALFNYLVFHNLNSKAYLESFTAYNERITNLAFQNIDKQIMEAAIDIPQLYFSDIRQNEDTLIPQEEDITGSPARIRGLVSQLEEIRKSYPHVASVDIYYEATQTIVTGFSRVHYIKQEREVIQYLPWYEEYLNIGRDAVFMESPEGIYPTKEPVITYVKRISQSKWKDRGIIVAIHISPSSFQEYIDEEEGTLVITSPGGRLLYVTQGADREVTETLLDDIKEEKEAVNPKLSLKIDDEAMTAFYSNSQKTNLNYVYYVQNSTFYADYNVRNRIFLMNFFISIIFNLIILAVFSWFNHYAYKKRLIKVSKDAGITLENEKASFDHSLNALTQEITTLNETVKSSKPLLFQNAVRSLILNRRTESAYERLNPYLDHDSVCTVVLYCQDFAGSNDLVVRLQEMFLNRNGQYHGLFTTMEKGELVSVLVFDKDLFDQIYEDFTSCIAGLVPDCRMVSGAVFDMAKDNIKNSFKSANEVSRYRFIFTGQQIIKYEDVDMEHRKSSGSHLKLFDAMERDINSENFLDFKYHIEGLTVSFKEGNYTIDYCISTLRDLVGLLYQIMVQRQLDMWIVFGYDIREYYKQIEDIDEFNEWVVDLCEVLLQNMRQKKKSVDMDMQTRLLRLIDENLENDISLDFLSDQFGLRPDVLSRMFKQMMGKSYTEYIKEKKMTRAVELIGEGHSMKDIAHMLGYNSPQYFIKIFKEVYGVTPYQYKKQQTPEK
ncbi:hypothetical protein C0033_09840 [Clostridium sp. chh4-2]|uniref:helix-turn-helix domain-containing protein n=1 Tax=Clostridium sp. chh4-2 TaxID=2067550 RepID=UPI000CCF15B1|nr:AraC family transcriptional regulator [Clostridium sp. chh4-2]PNV62399.1 hypothetical protein C0033_09840 [Clostridium sp. chh4-2]